jgi:iron complex transport system substrate-binding protein
MPATCPDSSLRHRSMRLGARVIVAVTVTGLTACGGSSSGQAPASSSSIAAAFPVTVRAANGPVTVPARPTAIVSLSPTATEMLYAMGAGDQVKAVDKYSNYPAGTPQTNMSALQINVESLVGLRPDLVVLPNPDDKLAGRLKTLSIPLLVESAATKIDDVYSEIAALGTATGHVQQATAESASIRSGLQAVAASVPRQSPAPTYFYELSPDYYSVTSDTLVGQVLGLIGLHSIADSAKGAATSGGYPQLSSEFVVKANPDYIFLADTICCHQNAAKVAKRPGWSDMSAVKNHHVVELSDDVASRWGPRIVDLLKAVADAVQADAG